VSLCLNALAMNIAFITARPNTRMRASALKGRNVEDQKCLRKRIHSTEDISPSRIVRIHCRFRWNGLWVAALGVGVSAIEWSK
jgi:hypothetical protein